MMEQAATPSNLSYLTEKEGKAPRHASSPQRGLLQNIENMIPLF
ncbi:hypothetical protein ACVITL_002961 [Rhizobium pisi]